ncbi:maleate cis-trans isomerase [Kribbella qitaiheensis]|uniref:Maleate cis-trans isomerase n=1 Tax=Kribbella qitaiheensis TaxID=1544730 RepID=A0A7G6X591_9ACTN|nr:maleate cis-trans isomerase [Kribbella qitaiheensis]QNE21406.1 maleate cis-trans isomerase [Kribbella qitaiheensis]
MDFDKVFTVGVLTPHAAPGPETEMPDMAPGQVRVEVSRTRNAMSCSSRDAASTSPDGLRAQAGATALDEEASALLPAVDVLAFASTGSGYALGYDEESALVRRLRERWDVPVCATSLSAVSALRSRQVKRISLVHPPWFGSSLNELGAEYFRSQGFEVVDARLAALPDDPDQVQPAMVVEWVAQHLRHRAEAVFIGGNGLRAARAIHHLESRTGRLVLQANQVLLWSVLQHAGAPVTVRGFGKLFDDRRPDGNKTEER